MTRCTCTVYIHVYILYVSVHVHVQILPSDFHALPFSWLGRDKRASSCSGIVICECESGACTCTVYVVCEVYCVCVWKCEGVMVRRCNGVEVCRVVKWGVGVMCGCECVVCVYVY